MEDVMIIQNLVVIVQCPCAAIAQSATSPFVGSNYYCESGTINTYVYDQPITSMTHCKTDLIAIGVLTVAPTLPYHGSTEIWVRALQVI